MRLKELQKDLLIKHRGIGLDVHHVIIPSRLGTMMHPLITRCSFESGFLRPFLFCGRMGGDRRLAGADQSQEHPLSVAGMPSYLLHMCSL